jgi:predicted enzyme related to lactoylglutathione lyase
MLVNNMIILYVSDQARSRDFYSRILRHKPVTDVPGMTEFVLEGEVRMGIMPERSIAKIIGDRAPNPASANGVPRCEIYLRSDDPAASVEDAVEAGAIMISKASGRDWGHVVSYCMDPDGHVIAFAKGS